MGGKGAVPVLSSLRPGAVSGQPKVWAQSQPATSAGISGSGRRAADPYDGRRAHLPLGGGRVDRPGAARRGVRPRGADFVPSQTPRIRKPGTVPQGAVARSSDGKGAARGELHGPLRHPRHTVGCFVGPPLTQLRLLWRNVLIFDVWATVQSGLLVLLAQLLVLLWRSSEAARMMVWRLEMWSQITEHVQRPNC